MARQTYRGIELIIIDDASSDDSIEQIERTVAGFDTELRKRTTLLPLSENVGNCEAFNKGLAACNGDYIIDLAGDDVMATDRVEKQVEAFRSLGESFGVIYSDANYIDAEDNPLGLHKVQDPVEGIVYSEVLRRYFIPPPTMMIRRGVLNKLGGYDETLEYEDFDFWVRSGKLVKYGYIPEPLTSIRRVKGSLSVRFYEKGHPLAASTFKVCEKALALNESEEDKQALAARIRYERRQCALLGNRQIARKYRSLLLEVSTLRWADRMVGAMVALPVDWSWLLRIRHLLRASTTRR